MPSTGLRPASGATTLITLTLARLMDITGRAGSTAATSSASVRGTAGAGVTDGATAVMAIAPAGAAADTDIEVATAIAVATEGARAMADTVAGLELAAHVPATVAVMSAAAQHLEVDSQAAAM